eukprot:TRINITY_DN2208_c0_g1_i4.p1 TRINITY_DN2208_c0_g1~~TRINITY_DN2208_c0_g1_i4.p1  ORF type:complete len:218 (+),score=25.65 TRINITY_DN2208_c0_g1_i4:196-849(+)
MWFAILDTGKALVYDVYSTSEFMKPEEKSTTTTGIISMPNLDPYGTFLTTGSTYTAFYKTSNGNIYCRGRNDQEICSQIIGWTSGWVSAKTIESLKPTKMTCSCSQCAVITESNDIYTWGEIPYFKSDVTSPKLMSSKFQELGCSRITNIGANHDDLYFHGACDNNAVYVAGNGLDSYKACGVTGTVIAKFGEYPGEEIVLSTGSNSGVWVVTRKPL